MQIEEGFRDVKSHRWGFALRYARCKNAQRLDVLMLVGTLATLVLWLVGIAGETRKWCRRLQANTERSKRVLFTVFVGQQLILGAAPRFTMGDLQNALKILQQWIAHVSSA